MLNDSAFQRNKSYEVAHETFDVLSDMNLVIEKVSICPLWARQALESQR